MHRVLDQLEPKAVFRFFEDLSRIPHGSHNTRAISDYCVDFAKARGLWVHQDALNNVIIKKPASAGYESAPAIILQGHLDMVAEKEPDSPIDLTRDALVLRVEGDFVRADGTTLGADDGIAVAMALAVLDDPALAHPALEVVFTVDEETGMDGAQGLDYSLLSARRMLNIDSEDEGVFTVSCAGGADAVVDISLERERCELRAATLVITGLTGGHSGVEINKGRASAASLLGRTLQALMDAVPLRLVSAVCGQKANAIAAHAEALLAIPDEALSEAGAVCAGLQQAFRTEYAAADPNITITLSPGGRAQLALSEHSTRRVSAFLNLAPNGVAAMSMDIPGLVQTSDNLGIFRVEDRRLHATFSVRSSIASQKQMLLTRIRLLAEGLDGTVTVTGSYPAWEYRRVSPLRDQLAAIYTAQTGSAPKIEAIHAGLECGLFAGALEGLDCVSFGPDLHDIHTTREAMSISSVQRTWSFLLAVLAALKD